MRAPATLSPYALIRGTHSLVRAQRESYLESYLGAKPHTVFNLLVGTKGASRRAPNDEPGADTYRSQSFNSRSGVSQTRGRRSTVLGTELSAASASPRARRAAAPARESGCGESYYISPI